MLQAALPGHILLLIALLCVCIQNAAGELRFHIGVLQFGYALVS